MPRIDPSKLDPALKRTIDEAAARMKCCLCDGLPVAAAGVLMPDESAPLPEGAPAAVAYALCARCFQLPNVIAHVRRKLLYDFGMSQD